MRDDLESARMKYKPDRVRFLFIGLAPPASQDNRFFYNESVSAHDHLFLETMRVLYPEDWSDPKTVRSKKRGFLERFMKDGCYLVDVSDVPLESSQSVSQLRQSIPCLMEKVESLVSRGTEIILISAPVFDFCYDHLRSQGYSVINESPIEFPAQGHQRAFRQKLQALLEKHGWRSGAAASLAPPAPQVAANRYDWKRLNNVQLGRYAEYYTKMEFTLFGFDVYSSEVDDRGIDFVIRKDAGRYYDVQVKSARGLNYIFFHKDRFSLRDNMLAAVVRFETGEPPKLYVIPSTAWRRPDRLLVSRDYEGKKSKPEWGIDLSKRNLPLLDRFSFDRVVHEL